MRISDWSSDVCSSDLRLHHDGAVCLLVPRETGRGTRGGWRRLRARRLVTVRRGSEEMTQPILRLGLVGGGPGSFIGPVHRMAACLDARFALVAGAFSRDIAKSRSQAAIWSLSPERAYDGIEAMLDG